MTSGIFPVKPEQEVGQALLEAIRQEERAFTSFAWLPFPVSVLLKICKNSERRKILYNFMEAGVLVFFLKDDGLVDISEGKEALYSLAREGGETCPLLCYDIPRDGYESNVLSSLFEGYTGFISYGRPMAKPDWDLILVGGRNGLVELVPRVLDADFIDLSYFNVFKRRRYTSLRAVDFLSGKGRSFTSLVRYCCNSYSKIKKRYPRSVRERIVLANLDILSPCEGYLGGEMLDKWGDGNLLHASLEGEKKAWEKVLIEGEDLSLSIVKIWGYPVVLIEFIHKVMARVRKKGGC